MKMVWFTYDVLKGKNASDLDQEMKNFSRGKNKFFAPNDKVWGYSASLFYEKWRLKFLGILGSEPF